MCTVPLAQSHLLAAAGIPPLEDTSTLVSLAEVVARGVREGDAELSAGALKKLSLRALTSLGCHKVATAAWPAVACAVASAAPEGVASALPLTL